MNRFKEALKVCKGLYDYRGNSFVRPYEMDSTTLDTIEELVDKEEKYRWHDLRKDPKDLPIDGYVVIVHFQDYPYFKDTFTVYLNGDFKLWVKNKIIAWKYAEEFVSGSN